MIKVSGNRRTFRGRKLGSVPKLQISKLRQAQKKSNIMKKVRDEPIVSTVMKSGLKNVRLFKLSDVLKDHRHLLMAKFEPIKKNWFMRFLDKARDTLYDPNNEIMFALKAQLHYNYLNNVRVEELYDNKREQLQ